MRIVPANPQATAPSINGIIVCDDARHKAPDTHTQTNNKHTHYTLRPVYKRYFYRDCMWVARTGGGGVSRGRLIDSGSCLLNMQMNHAMLVRGEIRQKKPVILCGDTSDKNTNTRTLAHILRNASHTKRNVFGLT